MTGLMNALGGLGVVIVVAAVVAIVVLEVSAHRRRRVVCGVARMGLGACVLPSRHWGWHRNGEGVQFPPGRGQ